MLIVGLFSAFVIFKSHRPSQGLPYEKLTMEQASEYMEFEEGYILLDIRDQEAYSTSFIPGSINIPYDNLVERIGFEVMDKSRIIYICGDDEETCARAAMKLSQMGYTGVTEIGNVAGWPGELQTE